MWLKVFSVLGLTFLFLSCTHREVNVNQELITIPNQVNIDTIEGYKLIVERDILMEEYFPFIDSIITVFDSLLDYPISEHIIVRANPWLIDTLQNTDYYRMKMRDSFVYDQKKMIVMPKGSVIEIPDSTKVVQLQNTFEITTIDVNIPEFKLRIYEDDQIVYEFPVRVGKNKKTFLEMSGKEEDLRTKTGSGTIIGYNKNPRYVNPVNNHQYFVTKRDDGKITKLPLIPFIEPEINGQRHGQLIHPSTNPETLGKASSNGCIGTREADAWIIYYYAPIGTNITIRYDLNRELENEKSPPLIDIYRKYPNQ